MSEVDIAGLNAVETALRERIDARLEPPAEGKKFERRDTVSLPIPDSAAERVAREDKWRGAHSRAPSSIDAMLAERNATHGDFTEDATTAQALKYVMRKGRNWEDMPPFMREALENMQTKIARLLAGDFNNPDGWRDLQGYPRLVETRLEK